MKCSDLKRKIHTKNASECETQNTQKRRIEETKLLTIIFIHIHTYILIYKYIYIYIYIYNTYLFRSSSITFIRFVYSEWREYIVLYTYIHRHIYIYIYIQIIWRYTDIHIDTIYTYICTNCNAVRVLRAGILDGEQQLFPQLLMPCYDYKHTHTHIQINNTYSHIVNTQNMY